MDVGDKVVCINDQNWRIESSSAAPIKDMLYVVKEIDTFNAGLCISLLGFPDDAFYLMWRFRKLDNMKAETAKRQSAGRTASVRAQQ